MHRKGDMNKQPQISFFFQHSKHTMAKEALWCIFKGKFLLCVNTGLYILRLVTLIALGGAGPCRSTGMK